MAPVSLPASVTAQGTHLTRERVAEVVGVLSGLLAHRGVGGDSGGPVALLCTDTGRTVLAFLALANVGARVVLVPDVGRLSVSDTVVVVSTDRLPASESPPPDVRLVDLSTEIRALMNDRVDPALAGRLAPVDLAPWFAAPATLGILTSGTTRTAALVWKDGPEILDNTLQTATALGYDADDVFLPLLPLSGQYGISVVLLSVVLGASLVVVSRHRLGEVVRIAARTGATAVDASPRLYRALLDRLRQRPQEAVKLQRVRVWGVGGSTLPPELASEFQAALGRPLQNGYGSTEFGNVALAGVDGRMRPLPMFELRVLGPNGRPATEEVGALHIRRRTGSAAGDGWIDTGDVALRRADGSVCVLGRAGSVQRNGYVLTPSVLESRLHAAGIPVKLATVDRGQGEVVVWAFVEDRLRRSVSYWRAAMDDALHPEERPNHVIVVGALPSAESDKVSVARVDALAARLEHGLHSRLHAGVVETPELLDLLMARAYAHRDRLHAILAAHADTRTAEAEYQLFLQTLQDAFADSALVDATPSDRETWVFLPSNAVLESYGLFCVIPALHASRVTVRPAAAVADALHEIHSLFADLLPHLRVWETTRARFLAEATTGDAVLVVCGQLRTVESVVAACGPDQTVVFFGSGHNAMLVGPEADPTAGARDAVAARTYAWGQDCLAPDIVFVHEALLPRFLATVETEIDTLLAAHLRLPQLAQAETLRAALAYLVDHSHLVVTGGRPVWADCTLTPAVLTRDVADAPCPTEHFAPILDVVSYAHLDEAVAALESEPYTDRAMGLSVYGVDEMTSRRLSMRYEVTTDRPLSGAVHGFEPFGGSGVHAGFVQKGSIRRLGPIHLPSVIKSLTPHRLEPLS